MSLRINICFVLLLTFILNDVKGQSQNDNAFDEAKFSSILIQGISAKISGDFYNADSLLKVCLDLNPKSAVSYFELSSIHGIKVKKN